MAGTNTDYNADGTVKYFDELVVEGSRRAIGRFKIIKGSASGHCCFDWTVVDVNRQDHDHPHWVCECFELADAIAIRDALNLCDGHAKE
jgi:hypothetical protein